MTVLWLLRVLHLTGFALLVTATVSGWILFRRYRRLEDYRSKSILLDAARALSPLGPVAILIMLVTGIGQMHMYGLGLFTQAWLTLKLFFFLITSVAGIIFGIRARTRGRLVAELARSAAPAGAEERIMRLDSQLRVFYVIQATLLLMILLLAVIKPGP
jgi:uncharacterized membrane protein SirB2